MILAAFFFSMSSDRFHSWMLNHKCSAGLTKRMKWVALIAITLPLGFSAFLLIDNRVVRIILLLVGVYAVWFVFNRPTRAKDES